MEIYSLLQVIIVAFTSPALAMLLAHQYAVITIVRRYATYKYTWLLQCLEVLNSIDLLPPLEVRPFFDRLSVLRVGRSQHK